MQRAVCYLLGNEKGIITYRATSRVLSIRQLAGYYLSGNNQGIIYPATIRVLSIRKRARYYLSGSAQDIIYPAARRVLLVAVGAVGLPWPGLAGMRVLRVEFNQRVSHRHFSRRLSFVLYYKMQ